jgi:hypothetical protein
MSADEHYIAQKIAVKMQGGSRVKVGLRSLSGNGWNQAEIRRPSGAPKTIVADKNSFSVRLISSDKEGTKIINV